MSHYYMRDHFGDYCTHYNRGSESYWHRCNAYPSEKVIFNYGCSSSCGCNFGINAGKTFWSGLGTGIGLGLGNLFGGFFSGFMMPFFGGGLFGGGLFGGMFGMPAFSNYGMVPNYVNSFLPSLTSSYTPTNKGNPGSTSGNNGAGNVGSTGSADGGSGSSSPAKTQTVDELKARAGQIDENSSAEDIQKVIDEIQAKLGDTAASLSAGDKADLENAQNTLKAQKIIAELPALTNANRFSDEDLELLIKQKNNLSSAQKNKLNPYIKRLLLSFRIDNNNYKCSNQYNVLLMLELSGLNVRAEHWVGNGDQYITGPISNVKKESDGSITYDIDCSTTGDCIKGLWTFEQSPDGNSCKPIYLKYTQCPCELNKNATYTWDSTDECWLNNDPNNPSAKKIYQ